MMGEKAKIKTERYEDRRRCLRIRIDTETADGGRHIRMHKTGCFSVAMEMREQPARATGMWGREK